MKNTLYILFVLFVFSCRSSEWVYVGTTDIVYSDTVKSKREHFHVNEKCICINISEECLTETDTLKVEIYKKKRKIRWNH